MRIFTTVILFIFFTFTLTAQQAIADFENFGLEPGDFIDNDSTGLGFESGFISLPNAYDNYFNFWSSGWAISATTDTQTAGFTNQYSSIVGSGYDGSLTYAIGHFADQNFINVTDGANAASGIINGMYVTNSTYAYLSMQEGDSFAKKFGGETGEDPDFFSIVFRAYVDGALTQDSVEFFLADFRSNDSSEDYILDEWEWVDLSSFGEVERISITMCSSDRGAFGINTPLYFCVDNIDVDLNTLNILSQNTLDLKVYPTLAEESINVNLPSEQEAYLSVYSLNGQQYLNTIFYGGSSSLNISQLPAGQYLIYIQQGSELGSKRFIKK